MKLGTWALCGIVLGAVSTAWAAPQLAITEIYTGVDGADITGDWFEITNSGDMAWDLTINPLWFDDSSADLVDAAMAPINSISSIAPNESVVVVQGGDIGAVVEFFAAWDGGGGQLTGVQIGWTSDNAGLGQGSDAVNIFDDVTGAGNIVAFQDYDGIGTQGSTLIYNPSTMMFGGNAQENVFGAYVAPGGPAGDMGEFPLIGSPGIVPEPASFGMLVVGAMVLVRRRK